MRIERPIFWHQGLFLQPQHFQLQEQALISRLYPFQQHLAPHFWGVGKLEIDETLLATGSFGLHSGSFLFADGSYLTFPGNALLHPRSLAGCPLEGKPPQLYAGIRRWHAHGENVTVIERSDDAAAATTRFVTMADPEEVKDLHGGGPDGQVKRLHYLVRIFWESELPELGDYLLIPLARLENAGSVKLSRRFIPPSLALDASEPLMRLVKEIRDQLAARGRQLAQCQSQRALQGSPDSPELLPLLALTAVNRQLPYLSHLAEAPSVHPWLAYGALQQLAGELSTFSRKEHPTDQGADAHSPLPPYDHQRLWECFSTAQAAVDRLIDAIAAGPERVVRLVRDGACYSADLKPSLIEEGARFYLGVSSRQERKSLLGSFHAVAKLSAREHLAVLTSRALPGIELQFLEVPPRELPLRSNTLYFAVDHRHDQWSLVAKQKNVALYWDDAPDDLEVDLLVFEQSQR